MTTYYTNSTGQEIKLGDRLGGGGEGNVFAVRGRPKDVAKIYIQAMTHERESKLRAMVSVASPALVDVTAWPTELVMAGRKVVGFVMPRADNAEESHVLYGPKSRRQKYPTAGFDFLVGASINVAKAFAVVHQAGIVIGDVNDRLAMIGRDARVRLIDCDSFQLVTLKGKFFCDVGVENFTPPELQGQSFRGLERSQQHDCFGLAVLIFHLLFLGRHPFAGRPQDVQMIEIPEAVRQHRFAYSLQRHRTRMDQPVNTLPLDAPGGDVASMFERAFSPDASSGRVPRPSAGEWVQALNGLYLSLVKCRENGAHAFNRSLSRCPWCEIETRTRIELFNYVDPGGEHVAVDVDAIWQAIEGTGFPALKSMPKLATLVKQIQPSPVAVSVRLGLTAQTMIDEATAHKAGAEAEVVGLGAAHHDAATKEAEALRLVECFDEDVRRLPRLERDYARAKRQNFWAWLIQTAGWISGGFGVLAVFAKDMKALPVAAALSVALFAVSWLLSRRWSGARAPSELNLAVAALQGSLAEGLDGRRSKAEAAKRQTQASLTALQAGQAKIYKAMVDFQNIQARAGKLATDAQVSAQTLVQRQDVTRHRLGVAQVAYDTFKSESQQDMVAAQQLREEARATVDLIRGIESGRTEQLSSIVSLAQEAQLSAYLDQFFIKNANLPRIPKSAISALLSNGIETAADVNRADVEAVAGFGPVRAGILVDWRNQCARGFVFNPNAGDQATRQAEIHRRATAARRPHERQLTKLKLRFDANVMPYLARKAAVETDLEVALHEMAQAQCDLSYVQSAMPPSPTAQSTTRRRPQAVTWRQP
jgi:DNA-binding helix-hairpin-helix protein with protein kinase domain